MGLDQYACTINKRARKNAVTAVEDSPYESQELFYWRKNRFLQNWMEKLYIRKCEHIGVTPREFNCDIVFLTAIDLKHLKQDIINGKLGAMDESGFFFGSGSYTGEQASEDLKFVDQALKYLEEHPDDAIFYSSWW